MGDAEALVVEALFSYSVPLPELTAHTPPTPYRPLATMSTILPQRPNTTSASDEPQLPPPCPCPACRTTSRLNSGSCVCDAWRHVRAEVVVGVSEFRFRLHMRTRAASPVDLSRSGPGWSCWSSRGLRAVGRCTVSLFCHVSVLAVYEEEGRTWLGLLLGDLVEWLGRGYGCLLMMW